MDPRIGPQDTGGLAEASATSEEESPGLPCFRTWRGVYLFVLAVFILFVVLFAVFSRSFS